MEKLLSIVVPAYNVEDCLGRCVSSLLPNERSAKLEVILVDDGSTDRTGELADRFAKNHPETISVIHKENGGHGSGVNVAVQKAEGRFFRVVDADDWLVTENLPVHLDELENCDADVVINSFYRVLEKRGRQIPVEIPAVLQGKEQTLEELVGKWSNLRSCFTIHGITYRRESYLASRVQLTEKIFYEDNEYTTLPFCQVQKVYFSPYFLYQYLIGHQGQSVSDKNQVLRLSQLEQVLFRVCNSFRSDTAFSLVAKSYILEKLYAMVNSCLITCLLRYPDRNAGQQKATALMEWLAQEVPEVYQRCADQYRRLQWLHTVHLSGKSLDRLLDSDIYLALRKRLQK